MNLLGALPTLINRRRVGAVAAAAVFLAAACGDDSDSDDSDSGDGTEVDAETTDASEDTTDDTAATDEASTDSTDAAGSEASPAGDLDALLLSLDDMPAGWTELSAIDNDQVCGNPEPAGRVTFTGDPQTGPVIGHVVDVEPGWYDATVAAFESCDTTDAEGNLWRGFPAEAPEVGERSQGFRMSITGPSGELQTTQIVLYEANGVGGAVLAAGTDEADTLLAEYAPVAADRAAE